MEVVGNDVKKKERFAFIHVQLLNKLWINVEFAIISGDGEALEKSWFGINWMNSSFDCAYDVQESFQRWRNKRKGTSQSLNLAVPGITLSPVFLYMSSFYIPMDLYFSKIHSLIRQC